MDLILESVVFIDAAYQSAAVKSLAQLKSWLL